VERGQKIQLWSKACEIFHRLHGICDTQTVCSKIFMPQSNLMKLELQKALFIDCVWFFKSNSVDGALWCRYLDLGARICKSFNACLTAEDNSPEEEFEWFDQ
jgi:hypothetical protein